MIRRTNVECVIRGERPLRPSDLPSTSRSGAEVGLQLLGGRDTNLFWFRGADISSLAVHGNRTRRRAGRCHDKPSLLTWHNERRVVDSRFLDGQCRECGRLRLATGLDRQLPPKGVECRPTNQVDNQCVKRQDGDNPGDRVGYDDNDEQSAFDFGGVHDRSPFRS